MLDELEKPGPGPSYPQSGSFAELAGWHLMFGTRPTGSPDTPGRRWSNKEFAQAVFSGTVDPDSGARVVRNWRAGRNRPLNLGSVERALFGDNAAYSRWRLDLRKAYDQRPTPATAVRAAAALARDDDESDPPACAADVAGPIEHPARDPGRRLLVISGGRGMAHPDETLVVPYPDGVGADAGGTGLPRVLDPTVVLIPPRNSVAIVPFVNLGDDSTPEYFIDGVVDDIIGELSYFRNLFVIAKSSSFSFGRRDVDVQRVGRELGVDYVVEGSLRRHGGGVRIWVRLVHAADREQVWAEKLDASLSELFALEDEVSQRIACAIDSQIQLAEQARVRRKPLQDLSAYDLYLRALPLCGTLSVSDASQALTWLRQSLEVHEGFPPALAWAAACCGARYSQAWPGDDVVARKEATAFARLALTGHCNDAVVLAIAGHIRGSSTYEYDVSAEYLDRALALNPNCGQAWIRSSVARLYSGDLEATKLHSDRALRISPRDPRRIIPLFSKGFAHLLLNELEEAVTLGRQAVALPAKPAFAFMVLIAGLWHLERREEAADVTAQFMRRFPNFRIDQCRMRERYMQDVRYDKVFIALGEAGVPW